MPRLALFVAVLAVAGCSSKPDQPVAAVPGPDAVLHEVGGLIQLYSGETGRGPKRAADLAKFESGYPLGYRAVQSGEVVVVWGAKMAGEGDAATGPKDVIAYEKKAPAEGGWALLQNGTTRAMTADEFKAAAKAK